MMKIPSYDDDEIKLQDRETTRVIHLSEGGSPISWLMLLTDHLSADEPTT